MPSTFPGALDSLPSSYVDATTSASAHPNAHNDLANAVNAVQSTLGVNPQGAAASVAARIAAVESNQVIVTGTTYTVDSSTAVNATLIFTSATAVTVTIANSIANGRAINWVQKGAGQLTFSAGSGATLSHRQTHTKSAGQYAGGSLICHENAGSAAKVILVGDTAA